jgi:serine/threonine-protein kinase
MNKTALLNNRYQVLKTIGRGGFGETYLAIDTHLPSQKKCVIKQLKPIIHEPQIPVWIQDRFRQEARILEHLGEQSLQIPRLYAYFSEAGNFYLVQEWIEGITLAQKVERDGNLPEKEVKRILISLLAVLTYIHNQQIVHRDIKPDNIILKTGNQLPILIDFGAVKEVIAREMTNKIYSTCSIAIGTPGYMASEQAAGRPSYASDLYSLGLTAVYLLTGKSPQYLKTDSGSGEINWRGKASAIDPNLAEILDKAIRFHPKDRFSSAQEMLNALQLSPNLAGPANAVTVAIEDKNTNPIPSEKKTLAINYSSADGESNNWSKAFLALLIISGLTLVNFVLGLKLWWEREKIPQSNISTLLDKQPISSDRHNSQPPEYANSETADSNLNSIKEIKPPTIIVNIPPQPTSIQKETPPSLPKSRPSRQSNPSSQQNRHSSPSIIGTSERELIDRLGQPTSQNKSYGNNRVMFSYENINSDDVNLDYTLNKDTRKILETKASFDSSVDLSVMENTLNDFLAGNVSQSLQEALAEVYQGETDLRSFNLGNVKGMIQRNQKDRIYIAIWDANLPQTSP